VLNQGCGDTLPVLPGTAASKELVLARPTAVQPLEAVGRIRDGSNSAFRALLSGWRPCY